jgi:hypothetical protein
VLIRGGEGAQTFRYTFSDTGFVAYFTFALTRPPDSPPLDGNNVYYFAYVYEWDAASSRVLGQPLNKATRLTIPRSVLFDGAQVFVRANIFSVTPLQRDV